MTSLEGALYHTPNLFHRWETPVHSSLSEVLSPVEMAGREASKSGSTTTQQDFVTLIHKRYSLFILLHREKSLGFGAQMGYLVLVFIFVYL